MEVTFRHGLEYETSDAVAIEDLVRSLEANARLLRDIAPLLTALFPRLVIEPQRVSVLHLSQESPLREIFAYSVLLTYQDELEEEVPPLIEALLGVEIPESADTLVTVLVMLVAIYGISKAYELLFPGRSKQAIDESRESLLKRAAAALGVGVERLREAVAVLVAGPRRRAIVTASQKVFAPTRNQPSPAIRSRQGEELVSPDAVRQAQSAAGLPYEPAEDEEAAVPSPEFKSQVRIVIHAMDRDRKRLGWAGHSPGLFDERIPMHLEKSLKPEGIYGRTEIIGDILLSYEQDEAGEVKPKEFLLIRAYL